MINIASTTSNTFTQINASTGSFPCQIHGGLYCNCSYQTNQIQCKTCNQFYNPFSMHLCSGTNNWTTTTGTTFPITGGVWPIQLDFKEAKEITTDAELTFELNSFTSINLKLPQKFCDCFLKVGAAWSPLYPLIFSAFANDEKGISFHLVTGITDKVFEGDKVILKSATTTKIEDNLTLLQLCQRTKDYFKDDQAH